MSDEGWGKEDVGRRVRRGGLGMRKVRFDIADWLSEKDPLIWRNPVTMFLKMYFVGVFTAWMGDGRKIYNQRL